MSYEVREAQGAFQIIRIYADGGARVIACRDSRDAAEREAGDLNRFAALLWAKPDSRDA